MAKKISLVLVFFLVTFLFIVIGCSNPTLSSEPSVSQKTESKISFDEYLKLNDFKEKDNSYIFEGDIAFGKSEVKKLYDDYLNFIEKDEVKTTIDSNEITINKGNIGADPSTGTRWVWQNNEFLSLTYKFSNSMKTGYLSDAQVKKAFKAAAAAWAAVTNVRFYEVSSYQKFTVSTYFDFDNFTAYSFFPNSGIEYALKVNLYNVDYEYNTYQKMVGLFTHELGHVIGLAHEHQRTDSPDTFGFGFFGEPYGPYDNNSIMSYANRPYTSGVSAGDIALVSYLYPPPVPVTISGPSILTNSSPMLWTVNIPANLPNYSIHYTVQRANDPPFSWDTTSTSCSFSAYSPTPITITLQVRVTATGYSPGSVIFYIYTAYNSGY